MRTIIKSKLIPLVVILVALIVVPVAYALFPAIHVVTELTVKEPLSLDSASVSGQTVSGTCILGKQPTLSASCTVSGFAGENVTVVLYVENAGGANIPINVSTASSSPDVLLESAEFCFASAPCTFGSGFVGVGGDALHQTSITVRFAISPSAPPGLVELVVEIVR